MTGSLIAPKYREEHLQQAVAAYLDSVSQLTRRFIWFHPPQEAQRSMRLASWLKLMGMKRGPADCILFCDVGKTIHIELKLSADLSPAQMEWAEALTRLGHKAHMVRAKTPVEAVNKVETILRAEGLL